MSTTFILSAIIAISSGLFLLAIGISGMVRSGVRKDLQEILRNK